MNFREKLIRYFFNTEEINRFNKQQSSFDKIHDFATDSSVLKELEKLFAKYYPSVSPDEEKIIDNKIIDSLGMMGLCSRLSEQFKVSVSYNEMTPENFNSLKAIAALIFRLKYKSNAREEEVFACDSEPELNISWEEAEKPVVRRVLENAVKEPKTTALIVNNKSYTYEEIAKRIVKFYEAFKKIGIAQGDKVLVMAICSEQYLSSVLALQLCHAVAVPVEQRIGLERVCEIANETNARAVITDQSLEKQNSEWFYFNDLESFSETSEIKDYEYPSLDSDEVILFTTGSTAKSKGVVLPHSAISWLCVSYPKKIKMRKHTVNITTYPLNHTSGLYISFYTLANLGTLILEDGMKNPASFFESLDRYKPNKISVPPMVFKMMVQYGGEKCRAIGKNVYNLSFGSEPMPTSVLESLKELFPNATLQNIYASTELAFISSTDCRQSQTEVPLGTPFEGVEIALKDETGRISSQKCKAGQICVKSKMQMRQYYNLPELTSSVMEDGWIKLSDMGYIDENGVLFFRGRADDVITIGGFKISPVEIEEVSLKSGFVTECICIKATENEVPVLKLLVVPNEKYEKTLLSHFLTENLEAYRVPGQIEEVEAIRRNNNGKLDRKSYMV